MRNTKEQIVTASKFLERNGLKKIHQAFKKYSLILSEIIKFMIEFAEEYIYKSALSLKQKLSVEL